MNFYNGDIEDLVHDSVSHKTFGDSNQITVLGHFQEGYKKTYIVKCSICAEDPELYQDGLFMCSRTYVNGLKLPCGCSSVPKWNIDQQYVRILRACSEMGYTVVTDFGKLEYENQYTKITVCCELHGERTVSIASITSKRRCRKCVQEESSLSLRKPDDIMIQGFLDSGAFHPETIFYRSKRKSVQGAKNYWWVECPVCNSKGEVNSSDLRKGNQPCECVKNQRQSYVNLVSDRETPVAIKFGIAKAYKTRVQKQNRKSIYDVTNLKAWEFPTKESCILAELECKQSLDCGVVPKEEMPDGFSETTHVYNLDKISEIFEKHGGVTIH